MAVSGELGMGLYQLFFYYQIYVVLQMVWFRQALVDAFLSKADLVELATSSSRSSMITASGAPSLLTISLSMSLHMFCKCFGQLLVLRFT